jgi:hypothetical protein
MNRTLFLAWLCAPTEEQRWQIAKEIFKSIDNHQLAVYSFWYERSLPGAIEVRLRRFWLNVSVISKFGYYVNKPP